jgi:hypothetical protein
MIKTLQSFHFSSCAYGHQNIELNYNSKTGLFEYRNRFPTGGIYVDMKHPYIGSKSNPLEEQIITELTDHEEDMSINPVLIEAFVKYVKHYCRHWKKSYDEPVMDGESWKFNIETNDFCFSSSGHMSWPGNFETFRYKLMLLTGGKMF